MTNDIDAIVDDLLARWHTYRSGYSHGQGYAGQDATCRDYKTPTHWDWRNGAEDDRAEAEQMKGIEQAVERVPNAPQPWNHCLHVEARNLASQAAVWTSARLPVGAELEVLRMEARIMLIKELNRDGLINW